MRFKVLMPMYKSMNVSCVISLIDFLLDLRNNGHEVDFGCTNGFNAAKARKALVKEAAEKENYDYALWLDSDHLYRSEDLFKLIDRMNEENLGMLSACYKLHGGSDTSHGIVEDDKFRHFKEEELKDDLIDCTVVGFGFLVMTKHYVKKMWDRFGDNLFILDAKENCTEDVKFCRCVLHAGDRVCFDPKVKVGHIETTVRY